MSVEELIDLAKALPAGDRLRLMKALEEDKYTKLEREFGEKIPRDFVAHLWIPEWTEEGAKNVKIALEMLKANDTSSL